MSSFIYVIAAREDGPCKIGFSKDPEKRLRQLQTGHPENLKLFHTMAVEDKRVKMIEGAIHSNLRIQRSKGEWFNVSVAEAMAETEFALIRWGEADNFYHYLK